MPAARTLKYNVFPKKRLFTDMLQTTLKLGVLNWCYRNCDIFLFIFKTWTLKNMDPGKHGVNMGLNLKICLNLVSCFIKTMRTMICCLTVYRYIIKMQQQQQNKKEKKKQSKAKKDLLIKYSVPAILIEWTNWFRIKSLNVNFSKYQNQPPGGVM